MSFDCETNQLIEFFEIEPIKFIIEFNMRNEKSLYIFKSLNKKL